jgi:antitoxin component YwqK of YwqJK toxin-antitoxin module
MIKIRCSYNDIGKYEGSWTEWYMSGEKRSTGSYKNGIMDGKWTYYYERGKVEYTFTKVDGEVVGGRVYHPSGKLRLTNKVNT